MLGFINKRMLQWRKLHNTALAKTLPEPFDRLNASEFRQYCRTFLQQNFIFTLQQRYSKLLSCCRPSPSLDPILWIPMQPIERSRLIRWSLGWLPGGSPRPCLCGLHKLTKQHVISCLHMHFSLHIPLEMEDPISCVLNRIPTRPSRLLHTQTYWTLHWVALYRLLYKVDMIQHGTNYDPTALTTLSLDSAFLSWITPTT
ncbi:MAG: hypothetical protein EXX96DRAFT_652531 [Benjaminiella poitrasii]|nr:MAG: hypothetical protein EXX96DRAFT_652531 [Benjaminiella poitrasii]